MKITDTRNEYEAFEPRLSIRISQEQQASLNSIFTHQGDKSEFFRSIVQGVIEFFSDIEPELESYYIYLIRVGAIRLDNFTIQNPAIVEKLLGKINESKRSDSQPKTEEVLRVP